jgi:TPR repeat protein
MSLFSPSVFAQSQYCASAAANADEEWYSTRALERCAAAGDAASQAMLGMMYWGASDSELCDDKGCRKGNPEKYDLSPALEHAVLEREGRRLLESAGGKGDARAQNELGLAFLDGLYGVQSDPVAARRWLTKATQLGDHIGAYNLARIYFVGLGVQRSPDTGEYLLRLSASRGYEPARCSLIVLLGRQQTTGAWLEMSVLWLKQNFPFGRTCSPDEIMAELP